MRELKALATSQGWTQLRTEKFDMVDAVATKALLRKVRPDVVFHTAGVFKQVEDPVKNMVTPNIRGTEAIVRACASAQEDGADNTQARPLLVLTSSMSAVRGQGQEPREGRRRFDHLDINSVSQADQGWYDAYQYSKAESERLAWELSRQLGVRLVVLCPSAIIGPERRLPSTAAKQFAWMRAGLGQAPLTGGMLVVDVKDAARAHIEAAERGADVEGERFIVSSEAPVAVAGLAEAFGILMAAPAGSEEAERRAREALKQPPKPFGPFGVECSKRLRAALGMDLRDLHRTLADSAQDLQAAGSMQGPVPSPWELAAQMGKAAQGAWLSILQSTNKPA